MLRISGETKLAVSLGPVIKCLLTTWTTFKLGREQSRTNLLRHIKGALLKLQCSKKKTPPQKCLLSPSLFNVVVCFLELQIFWGRTVHLQSNIERGKGRGKGNKNANVSLSCLNSFVRDWSSTCFFSCRLWTVIHPSIEQYPKLLIHWEILRMF